MYQNTDPILKVDSFYPRSFDLSLKDDKEIAKGQSTNPSSAKSPTPTAESIEQVVNEALRVYRKK